MVSETLELVQGQLNFPGEIRRYIMGGNSTFTLVSKKTGQRFTYKVKSSKKNPDAYWSTENQDRSAYFVSVLNGPDNSNDYQYMGILGLMSDGSYKFISTRNSKVGASAPSFKGFAYVWEALEQGCTWPSQIEFWHEGSCCICGRKLTVPESVADGIGPECKGKVGLQ